MADPRPQEFYVIPDENRVSPAKKGDIWQTAETIQQVLAELFPVKCKYGACNPGECTGATVIDRLIDTSETRIGKPPEGTAREALVKQATKAIQEGKAVGLVGIYGTPRHLDRPDLNKAQLSDFAAIMMAQAALDRVYSAYKPGAFFHMVDENLTALWLDIAQHSEGQQGMERFQGVYKTYFNDRQRLLSVLAEKGWINTGNTRIDLLSESIIYEKIWKQIGSSHSRPEYDFLARCEVSRPKILNYLLSSGEVFKNIYGNDDQHWPGSSEQPHLWEECLKGIEGSSECKVLQETGWSGLIPPEMRSYYLAKFRQILGRPELAADDPLLLFHVATYLSSTLEKAKAGTLTHGLPEGTPIIKIPLVRPVDGRPPTHQALVAQRTFPEPQSKSLAKKVSNANRSAWGSVAVHADGKLRLMDVGEYIKIPEESVIPAQIYMVGPDKGQGSYIADTAIITSR